VAGDIRKLGEGPKVRDIEFEDRVFRVVLTDGGSVSVPLEWYPQLRDASEEARRHWEPGLGGLYIKWPLLDLMLLVEALQKAKGPVLPWEEGDR